MSWYRIFVLSVLLGQCLGAQAQARSSGLSGQSGQSGLVHRHVEILGPGKVSLALALPIGSDHDPTGQTGLAQCMGALLLFAQDDVAAEQRFLVQVLPRYTLLSQTFPAKELSAPLQFLARVLSGKLEVTPDLHALALGRARLQADDETWLYPGPILRHRALRQLLKGKPGGRQGVGIPSEIGSLSVSDLEEQLRRNYGLAGACLVSLGDLPDARARELVELHLAGLPPSQPPAQQPPAQPPANDPLGAVPLVTEHPRVDGPYVTAAFTAPAMDQAEYPAFVVAMVVLRLAAHREFGAQRGAEGGNARFPYVAFRYWEGDPLVMLNRRGPNGARPEVAKSEIQELIRRLRRDGCRVSQLTAAKREVARSLAAPPYSPGMLAGLRSFSGGLVLRARYLAVALCCDWPVDLAARAQGVELAEVQEVLESCLRPEKLGWLVLEARPRPRFLSGRRR